MRQNPRPGKPVKVAEPEYTWGETPGGRPELLWEHAARPLWAQAVPARDGMLLLEKDRMLYRRASTGEVLWQDTARELPDELAADTDSLVFAWDSHLEAREPDSGKVRWRQRPGGPITGVAVSPETVFASTKGPLFALNRADGKQRWRATCVWEPELRYYVESNLLAVDDPESESIRALDASTGTPLWEYSAPDQPVVAGPLTAGSLMISGHAAGVAAVDALSGEVRWRLVTERTFEAAAVDHGGALFCTDGTIHALDPATGEVRWRKELIDDEDGVFTLRADDDLLFAETWRGRLLALDPADGSLRWERQLGQVHGMTADQNTVYLRTHVEEPVARWSVVALDRTTGDLRWELIARRMVPDVNRIGDVMLVELKNQVLALRALQA
ncbi:MAG: PQQ-binding-like beta-propeller repeat protein [Actinomycetota bacterium]